MVSSNISFPSIFYFVSTAFVEITILACAEILVSVTGLEYSYSSSPESMKAFVLALYLLTTSIGDLLGGVLYSSVFAALNRAITLHLCAFIMLLNLFCFIGVARWYENSVVQNDENEGKADGSAAGEWNDRVELGSPGAKIELTPIT